MRKSLYVSQVGHASDLVELEDLFTTVADVHSQRLELIPESSSQTFGVFEMGTEQEAVDCMERFNGHELNGRRLAIVCDRPKPRPIPEPKAAPRKRR